MKKWATIISFLLLFHFLSGTAAEASAVDEGTPAPSGIDIAGTITALRQFKLSGGDPSSIPIEVRSLLTTLKHQLRDLASMTLDAYATESKSVVDVRKALSTALTKQGIAPVTTDIVVVSGDYEEPEYTYGDIREIAIYKPADHTDLIGVTITLGVYCGSDTSLYIFKQHGQKWNLFLAQEATDYDDISGAQGRFRYAISPPSGTGQFYVVTKNVNPWCSSNWQRIRYQVMRQGIAAYEPKILLKQEDGIYLGTEHDGFINISPTGFTLEFVAGQRLDSGVLTRRHILAYQVMDDQVQRVPPFGEKPEDFLDEWFDLPWEAASKWVLPSASLSLRSLHAKFRADHSGRDTWPFYTNFVFDPPACRIKPGAWQVGIALEPSTGKSLPAGIRKAVYFTIIEKEGNYFLKGTSRASLPRCRY